MRAGFRMVAAALALLLVVPALVRAQEAREAERKAACMANVKQLLTGLMMYAQDYDERFPPAGKWSTNVIPYVKSRRLFNCPADSGPWSYAFNRDLGGVSMGWVSQPAETTMLFEADFHKPNAFGLAKDAVYSRHLGHGTFGYVDGHVKMGRTAPPFGPIKNPAPRRIRR